MGWQVLPLQLENLSIINFSDATTATEQSPASSGVGVTVRLEHGPVFYRCIAVHLFSSLDTVVLSMHCLCLALLKPS